MAKVKVHELAKELNIQTKELIGFLEKKQIDKKNPMNNLEESEVSMVREHFVKKEGKTITKQETEVKTNESKSGEAPGKTGKNEETPSGHTSMPGKTGKNEEKNSTERPKKKSSITAVFNPQNSQQGMKRRPRRRPKDRTQQEKATVKAQEKPAVKPAVKPAEKPPVKAEPAPKTVPKPAEEVKQNTAAAPAPTPAPAPVREEPLKTSAMQNVKITGNIYQDRPKPEARPQGEKSRSGRERSAAGRNQGDRSGNRSFGDRNRGGRSENRPQGDRGGRGFDKNNQRSGQNNRQNPNYNQSDRGNRQGSSNRPKEFKGKLDREISKFNKEAVAPTEELRGKETRERSDSRKNNNRKQDHDKLGKKQERFINLEKQSGRKKPRPQKQEKEEAIKSITLPEKVTIKELAEKMKVQAAIIVKKLFLKGTMVTVNQEVDYDTAEEIALEFNCIAEPEEKVDVIAELLKESEEDESKLIPRPPVVCVMGHVDHGKTSLLDAIRSTRVTDREAGGITQHIGASVVLSNNQNITFLDTPGHEAFTAMRMRGANATDIAILVVAADDGVMPQTVEAINHAKAAGIEIIVAINKIDKPNANIERVKQELSEYELIPEDWGGSTIFCPVSARTREGLDNLLEMILLTAEVCELKANPDRNARGLVIEAQLDKGRGAVATILVQKGTLRVGEPIACGSCYGKVRAMIDDKGRRVKEAGPSTPVEILGLSGVPNAGEVFVAMDTEKESRAFAETFISEGKERLLEETKAKMSLDDLFSQIQSGNVKELDLIVKADVQGSVEAVKQSLEKLSNEEVIVKTIHGGVGAINESDVILASASNAIIIGFNVRPDQTAKATAEREGVDVRLYKVIYNAIEDVEAAMKGMLDPIFEEKILGHAEVRQIFKSSEVGNIAGSYILDGIFERGCKVRVTREGKQVFEGELASLKRFKDDVKEVRAGYECGLVLNGFSDIMEFDQIEAYKMVEVPR